jgi:hypothetical protein
VTLSTRTLKIMSAVGAAVICAASGVLVAIDAKQATAPLQPPVARSSGAEIPLSSDAGGSITPSVTSAPASTAPLINSYVS